MYGSRYNLIKPAAYLKSEPLNSYHKNNINKDINYKMDVKAGVFYGIGVGPGDPELLTLKAVKVLKSVDIVFAAASAKKTHSIAYTIAKEHIPDTASLRILTFPMTNDLMEKEKNWENHARIIIKELEQNKKVAFITLGDPMTYSTYGYILKHIQKIAPHLPVVSISGITSYQAAAASLNLPLVEGDDSLLLTSGVNGGESLRKISEKPKNIVFLKAYRKVKDIVAAIDEAGSYATSVGVSSCGQKNEKITKNIKELYNTPPDYWTLILAKQENTPLSQASHKKND